MTQYEPPPTSSLANDAGRAPAGAGASSRGLRRGERAFRRAALALFLAGFATFSLIYCVQPLLPTFAAAFGVSPAASSLPLSLATAALAFAIFASAAVSEGFGRREVMFASMALAAAFNIAAAAAPSWTLLVGVRAASGLALGGVPSVAMTYLAEEVEPSGLGFAMGVYIAGTAFGGMIGRVGGGALAEAFGWRPAIGLVALADLAAAAGFIALLPPSRRFIPRRGLDLRFHLDAWRAHLKSPALPYLFAVGFLVMGAFVTVYNYVEFRLLQPPFNLREAGLGLISLVYVFGIAASWAAGALVERLGRRLALPLGVGFAALGIALTLFQNFPAVLAGVVVVTMGFFFTHAIASGWVGRLAAGAKGHAASLYLLAYYVGGSAAGWAGGWFWSAGGWSAVAAFTGSLLTIALAAALRLAFIRGAMGSGRLS